MNLFQRIVQTVNYNYNTYAYTRKTIFIVFDQKLTIINDNTTSFYEKKIGNQIIGRSIRLILHPREFYICTS
jgi:hypothetical protein